MLNKVDALSSNLGLLIFIYRLMKLNSRNYECFHSFNFFSEIQRTGAGSQTFADDVSCIEKNECNSGNYVNDPMVPTTQASLTPAPLYCINSNEIRYENEEREFSCQYCCQQFSFADFLDIHVSEHIRKGDPLGRMQPAEPLFRCLPCSVTFNSFDNFRSHSEEVHPFNQFPPKKRRRVSTSSEVDIIEEPDTKPPNLLTHNWAIYKCSICQTPLKSWTSYIQHIIKDCKINISNRQTTCVLCSLNTNRNKLELLKHIFECHIVVECFKCQEEVHGREFHGHLLNHGITNITNFLTCSKISMLKYLLEEYFKHCKLCPRWICVNGTLSNEAGNSHLVSNYDGQFSWFIVAWNGTWVCTCYYCRDTFCHASTAVRHHYESHPSFHKDVVAVKYMQYLEKLSEISHSSYLKTKPCESDDAEFSETTSDASQPNSIRQTLLDTYEYIKDFKDLVTIERGVWRCRCHFCDASFTNPQSGYKHIARRHKFSEDDKYVKYLSKLGYKITKLRKASLGKGSDVPLETTQELKCDTSSAQLDTSSTQSDISFQELAEGFKKVSRLIEMTSSGLTFSCVSCEKCFRSPISVRMHLIKKHDDSEQFYTEYLKFISKYVEVISDEVNRILLQDIWKEFRSLVTITRKRWQYKCLYCNETFFQPYPLIFHINTCHIRKGEKGSRYVRALKTISGLFASKEIISCIEKNKSIKDESFTNSIMDSDGLENSRILSTESDDNTQISDGKNEKVDYQPDTGISSISDDGYNENQAPVIRISRKNPKIILKRKLLYKKPEKISDGRQSQMAVSDIPRKKNKKNAKGGGYPVLQERLDLQTEVDPDTKIPKEWTSPKPVECWYCGHTCITPRNLMRHLCRKHKAIDTAFIKKYKNAIRKAIKMYKAHKNAEERGNLKLYKEK